ncbi:transmembrane protein 214-A-like isoform X2 [Eriocheir sinensis]|uniref:transmembrane protein 214-A-like isoform X2 n=1 Tax=Eriocheir sinensis TaxID=95602 RepID=UPI0021C5FB64|nr:transmembrane protein 214-A-like isoform X2 [Eriocheir sinensis]
MAATGEWELVKNSRKKGSSVPNGKLSKEEKKSFIEKAPKVNTGRIESPATGKENRKPKVTKNAKEGKKKPEKKQNDAPHQPGTLQEAIGRLNVGQMENLLDVVKSRFQDSPLIWLKDLASYLNVRVNPIHAPDPAFRGHPPLYPTSMLSSSVKNLLIETFSCCSDSVLASFHKHCVTSMVQEQVKGLSVIGYKLFIQILSIQHPEAGLVNLPFYCELRHSIQNQTPACLSLLWAVGQLGHYDFITGLKVWLQLMVPLIGLKHYSAHVVEYGSTVFGSGGGDGAQACGDVLGVREFFTILDFTWCSSGSLTKPVQRQLFALYPKVKTAAFSSNPEVTLRNFFPSFLRRLDVNITHLLRVELLTCLVQCLMQDPQCWIVWSQLYLKHLVQSAVLLDHLGREWKVLSQSLKVKRKEVKETIEKFAQSNQQMSHKAAAVPGVLEATQATEALLNQMKTVKEKSHRPSLFNFVAVLTLTAVVWDIRSAGSFKGSKLGQTIEGLGLTPYLQVAGEYARAAFIHIYRWCMTNVPVYYSRGCELAGPYLLLMLEKLDWVLASCWTAMDSAAQYIPPLKEKIETMLPGVTSNASYYGSVALQSLENGFYYVQNASSPYLAQAHTFLSTRVFVGPLAPEKLQEYVFSAAEYISQLYKQLQSIIVQALEEANNATKATS